MFCKRVVYVMLLAVFGYIDPAHAVTATLSAGTAINPDTKTADGGTFTTQPYTTTTTFNGVTPNTTTAKSQGVTTTTYTYTSGILKYTWSTTAATSPTSIRKDQYAPPNPNGQVINQTLTPSNNTSDYPAVFANSPITIDSTQQLNYIGIDWGYVDQYNKIEFYNTTRSTPLIGSFVSTDFFGSPLPSPEGSSYAEFTASNNTDTFNRIVLSNTNAGTGFETDNYAVRVAPAPSSTSGILALAAIGAWKLLRRRQLQA